MPRLLRVFLISFALLLGLLALGFLGQALHTPPEEKWFSAVNTPRANPEFAEWTQPQIHWQPRDLDTLGVTCDLESDPNYVILRATSPWTSAFDPRYTPLLHADAQGKITLPDGTFIAIRKLVVFSGEHQQPRGFSLVNGTWEPTAVTPEEAQKKEQARGEIGVFFNIFLFFDQSDSVQSQPSPWPIETIAKTPLFSSLFYRGECCYGWDTAIFPAGFSITLPIVIHHGEPITTTLPATPNTTSSISAGNIRYCGEKSGIGWKVFLSHSNVDCRTDQTRFLAFIHDIGPHTLSRVDAHLVDGRTISANPREKSTLASIFELKAEGDISHFTLHQSRNCARVLFQLPPLPFLTDTTSIPTNRFDFRIPSQWGNQDYRGAISCLENGLGMQIGIPYNSESHNFQIPNTGQTLRELLVQYITQCGYTPEQIEVDSDANVIRIKISRWEKIKKWCQENWVRLKL